MIKIVRVLDASIAVVCTNCIVTGVIDTHANHRQLHCRWHWLAGAITRVSFHVYAV